MKRALFYRDRKPSEPIIEELLYRNTLVQLSGEPGCHKSFAFDSMAVAIASGQKSWEGHKIHTNGPVVIIKGERESNAWLRIAAAAQHARLP